MNHTPTPWTEGITVIESPTKDIIACFHHTGLEFPNFQENIKRILACVNACAEFEDPAKEIAALKAQAGIDAQVLRNTTVTYEFEVEQLKARVAELEQGVKDAIAEMDRYYSLKLGVRILKNKLKL